MSEQQEASNNKETNNPPRSRGIIFSLFLILGGVYNFTATILFFIAILTSTKLLSWSRLGELTSDGYFQENLIIASSSFLLYLLSFIGVVSMWRQKKLGFKLYTFSFLFILLIHLLVGQQSLLIISAGVVLLFIYFLNKSKLG